MAATQEALDGAMTVKREAPRLARAGTFTAVIAMAASFVASVHWLFPLARAANCFEPRESTWIHAAQSLSCALAATLLTLLGLFLSRRANTFPRVRNLLLWGAGLLGILLVVPVVFIAGVGSDENGCSTGAVGPALVASTLLLPALSVSLPAFTLRADGRGELARGASSVATAAALWAALFVLLRPWEYPGF